MEPFAATVQCNAVEIAGPCLSEECVKDDEPFLFGDCHERNVSLAVCPVPLTPSDDFSETKELPKKGYLHCSCPSPFLTSLRFSACLTTPSRFWGCPTCNSQWLSHSFASPYTFLFSEAAIPYVYLVIWLFLNIVITLYMKLVFSTLKFPHPLTMTIVHMCFTTLGVKGLHICHIYLPKPIPREAWYTILMYSVVFSLNVFLSNASLLAVSVSFHQVARTVVPLFTIFISFFFFNERYSLIIFPPVILVIFGVALTIWDDITFTMHHLIIVLLGCFFASLKGILTQKTQLGTFGFTSLDLLRCVSPLTIPQLFLLAACIGEIKQLLNETPKEPALLIHLAVLGCIAFVLNFVSFRCAALLSPLTLNIAGNIKLVVTTLLSFYLFGGLITLRLALGFCITAIAAYWYFATMEILKRNSQCDARSPSISKMPLDLPAQPSEAVRPQKPETSATPVTVVVAV